MTYSPSDDCECEELGLPYSGRCPGSSRCERRTACRCGGDMPGRCPGPANCPMERATSEEETD